MNKVESHAAEALERLCELFKVKPNIRGLIEVWCEPIQAIEEILYRLLTERTVAVAVGVQLDTLGKIVGQPRGGLDDDDYRRYIRARIKTNRSSGTTNQILEVARLIVNDEDALIRFDPSYPAAAIVRITEIAFDTAIALALIKFLREAGDAGVRIVLEWSTVDPEDTFFWDTTSWDDGLLWVTSTE